MSTDTADILKKGLTGALTADTKTYEGATTATGSIGLTGGVGGALVDILRRPVTMASDNGFKPFGHVDPPLTYRVNVASLVAPGGGKAVAALR